MSTLGLISSVDLKRERESERNAEFGPVWSTGGYNLSM